jgi:diguanylate cyclase (GGDEF)-like protein/PAS domain S-box-containing protein
VTDAESPTGTPPDPQWFQKVADHSGLVFFILRVQPDVALEFVNGGTPQLESADELLTMQPGDSMEAELTWRHVTGKPIHSSGWVQCRKRPDESVVVEGALRDVTALRAMQRELRNSEQRHRLLAHNAWDVVWTMGLDGSITYVSPAVERVRGFTPEEAMRQPLEEIHPPESAAKVADYFAQLFVAIENGTEVPVYRAEHEYYRKDGSVMTGELQVIPHVDADGKVVEILGVTRDISDRKLYEAELTRLAVTDPVTGLWNRRHTGELLAADLAQAQRHGQSLTLLMVDIDHFKAINDTHGHQTGDRVLIEVARRLQDNIRSTDVVGRWGGEEFMILLRYCTLQDGVATADKLRSLIADSPIGPVGVRISVGAATLQAGEDLDAWVARADSAMYRAKRAGRNTVAGG